MQGLSTAASQAFDSVRLQALALNSSRSPDGRSWLYHGVNQPAESRSRQIFRYSGDGHLQLLTLHNRTISDNDLREIDRLLIDSVPNTPYQSLPPTHCSLHHNSLDRSWIFHEFGSVMTSTDDGTSQHGGVHLTTMLPHCYGHSVQDPCGVRTQNCFGTEVLAGPCQNPTAATNAAHLQFARERRGMAGTLQETPGGELRAVDMDPSIQPTNVLLTHLGGLVDAFARGLHRSPGQGTGSLSSSPGPTLLERAAALVRGISDEGATFRTFYDDLVSRPSLTDSREEWAEVHRGNGPGATRQNDQAAGSSSAPVRPTLPTGETTMVEEEPPLTNGYHSEEHHSD